MQLYQAHETAIIDQPVTIGANTKVWHFCHLMPHSEVGENCSLGQNVFIASNVKLGNGVKVQNNVSIYEGVICEDDVFLGPSMVFTNIKNPRSAVVRKGQYLTTYLEKGVSVGANATIICGVTIGKYAMIGAGSVVTHDVLPYQLIVGVPGRAEGWVSTYGHRLAFGKDGRAVCPESGEVYSLEKGIVSAINLHD
ncbi:MAG: DapH/DapD/GlmU-related protein [Bacteroidota bacterium]